MAGDAAHPGRLGALHADGARRDALRVVGDFGPRFGEAAERGKLPQLQVARLLLQRKALAKRRDLGPRGLELIALAAFFQLAV